MGNDKMHLTYSDCLKKHHNDYTCKVMITSHITWFPFELLVSKLRDKISSRVPGAKFFETSVLGLRERVGRELIPRKFTWGMLINLLLTPTFYLYFFQCTYFVFQLFLKFDESKDLGKLRIKNIKIGDIVAAEYLRSPAKGNGNLKINFRFYILVIKYLIVYINFIKTLDSLLKKYRPHEIRFCLQETSFKDEMLRRIFINKNILFEYQFDKFQGKLVLFEYKRNSQGSVLEYTPKLKNVTEEEIEECRLSLDKRIYEGIAVWTGNVTDIDSTLHLDEESHTMIDPARPVAVLFLHAVADDQFRCGLDCFKSIDDFHKFTIKTVLSLGYQCILKPHPGIKSALHPDKTLIDDRYVMDLFDGYGLDYRKTTDSFSKMIHRSEKSRDLFSMNPRISIKSILDKINYIALTHHGNVTYEALHLNIPVLKYLYCKSREFDFSHSWADLAGYVELLKYYSDHRALPQVEFKDSYLTVSAILSRKKKNDDYNKVFINSYREYFREHTISIPPRDAKESVLNIEIIRSKYENDEGFKSFIGHRLNALLG